MVSRIMDINTDLDCCRATDPDDTMSPVAVWPMDTNMAIGHSSDLQHS